MKFSWWKSLRKGGQGLLEFVAAAAIVAAGDAFFTSIDEPRDLLELGIPAGAVAIALFFVRIGVNWWKVRRAIFAAGKLRG